MFSLKLKRLELVIWGKMHLQSMYFSISLIIFFFLIDKEVYIN